MISTSAKSETPRIAVVFRNDDLSALSDLRHEEQIFQLFERFGVPQTLGVIPMVSVSDLHCPIGAEEEPLTREHPVAAFLRGYMSRSGSEIALHGYTHRTGRRSIPARREYFEFRKLSVQDQESLLRKGIVILEHALGVRPTTFIPPWNRLDDTTVAACLRVGFKAISAGPFVPTPDGLVSFGANIDLAGFPQALASARRSGAGRLFLNVLFHSRFLRTGQERDLLARNLEMLRLDPECEALTVAQVAARMPDELELLNQAARNAVPLHQVSGSVRAKAWLYVRGIPAVGNHSGLNRLQQIAQALFRRGDYASCVGFAKPIDQKCLAVLWGARASLFLGGCLAGGMVTVLLAPICPMCQPWLGLIPTAVLVGGVVVSGRATADDTRHEMIRAAVSTAAGFLLPLLLGLRHHLWW